MRNHATCVPLQYTHSCIDAPHQRRLTAATIIGGALVNVATIMPVTLVAQRTLAARVRAGQIHAAHLRLHRTVRPLVGALVHVHGARHRHSIRAPALLADARIAAHVVRLHARTVAAHLRRRSGQTVDGATRTVETLPAGRTAASERAVHVLAGGSVLTSQIGAGIDGALVDVQRARWSFEIVRARARERPELVATRAAVLARIAGAVVRLEAGGQRGQLAFESSETTLEIAERQVAGRCAGTGLGSV